MFDGAAGWYPAINSAYYTWDQLQANGLTDRIDALIDPYEPDASGLAADAMTLPSWNGGPISVPPGQAYTALAK